MNRYFADLHVHVGRSSRGNPIKWATSKDLTLENIARECVGRKGIQIIGVVDCISPYVLEDMAELLDSGELVEDPQGGMLYRDIQSIIPGAELETHEIKGCSAHTLCFFPTFEAIKTFSASVSKYIRNLYSCSSMTRLTARELLDIVDAHGGVFIPAHIFTPHKSYYGSCCLSLREIFDKPSLDKIPAVELGLSADSYMASQLSELDGKGFLSNSDAHSLNKIGREYNVLEMAKPTYRELLLALKGEEGRRIACNYGLDPRLGKYHRTFCRNCGIIASDNPPVVSCHVSPSHKVVTGVKDRLELIKDRPEPYMEGRAPYHYQIPLEFVPGIGPRVFQKLLQVFGTEMKVLHEADGEQLKALVGEETAGLIIKAREGRVSILNGGGGIYGKLDL